MGPRGRSVGGLGGSVEAQGADALYVNGSFITLDPARPRAQAVAVRGGDLMWVGTDDEVRRLARADSTVVDLRGRTVVPGFVEAEQHLETRGICELDVGFVNARYERSDSAVLRDIERKARHRRPGEWVKGNDARLRFTKEQLDAASPEAPVAIWLVGLISQYPVVVVNSAALKMAGVGPDAPDPANGRIVRDERGAATGVLEGAGAIALLPGLGPLLPTPLWKHYSPADVREAIRAGTKFFSRMGITTMHNLSMQGPVVAAYLDLYTRRPFPIRDLPLRIDLVPLMSRRNHDGTDQDDLYDEILDLGLRPGFGSRWIRFQGVKGYCDGELLTREASMNEPYLTEPRTRGWIRDDMPAFAERVRRCHEAGLQVSVHAYGDHAIGAMLDVFEDVLRRHPRADHRHRLQHCGICPPPLIRRIAELGLLPVSQPVSLRRASRYARHLGGDRMRWFLPLRSWLDAGIPLPGSADYGPYDPLKGIGSAVARRDEETGEVFAPEEALTAEEALRMYTLGSARAGFEEDEKGSISRGKFADMAVLSADPLSVAPDDIGEIQVEMTILDGEVVYERTN